MKKSVLIKVMVFFLCFTLSGIMGALADGGFGILKIQIEDYKSKEKEEVLEEIDVPEKTDKTLGEIKGVWVASVYGIDFPEKEPTRDSKVLAAEIDNIIKNSDDLGFNTIYFQVRPSADALYKSEIFPWSKYLTGEGRQAPTNGFDPLEYMVEKAHKKGIRVEAWINPYRVAVDQEDYESLPLNHPAKKNKDWVVPYKTGSKTMYFFDPGMPEVEELVMKGIEEIVDNYEVDGIHMDDYFYPGNSFDDDHTYKIFRGNIKDKNKWRRDNINNLVRNIGRMIDNKDKGIVFGISPFGIWANDKSMPTGSKTTGSESYYKMYADTKKWVEDETIDYIMPQIYWNIGYEVADYKVLVEWWNDVVEGKDVKLYIGQAAYRTEGVSKNSSWYGSKELEKQIELNKNYENVEGFVMFNYSSVIQNKELVEYLKK